MIVYNSFRVEIIIQCNQFIATFFKNTTINSISNVLIIIYNVVYIRYQLELISRIEKNIYRLFATFFNEREIAIINDRTRNNERKKRDDYLINNNKIVKNEIKRKKIVNNKNNIEKSFKTSV